MSEPTLVVILDAILALIAEIRVTGTVSLENLAGVKSLVGEMARSKGDRPAYRAVDPASIADSLRAAIPDLRAAEEAYRKAGEVSQADLRYEVRAGGAPRAEERADG